MKSAGSQSATEGMTDSTRHGGPTPIAGSRPSHRHHRHQSHQNNQPPSAGESNVSSAGTSMVSVSRQRCSGPLPEQSHFEKGCELIVSEIYNTLTRKRQPELTTQDLISIIRDGLGPAGLHQFQDLSRMCPNELLNCYNRFELVWNLEAVKNAKVNPWRPSVDETARIHKEFRKILPELFPVPEEIDFMDNPVTPKANLSTSHPHTPTTVNTANLAIGTKPEIEPEEKPAHEDDVKIAVTKEKGRVVEAAKDLPPGAFVLADKPYVKILNYPHWLTHCQSCLKRLEASPRPCQQCFLVMFCSNACKEAANFFHSIECPQMGNMLGMRSRKNSLLVYRIFSQTGLAEFKKLQKTLRNFNGKEHEGLPPSDLDFSSYLSLFYLHRKHSPSHSTSSPFHRRRQDKDSRKCLDDDEGPLSQIHDGNTKLVMHEEGDAVVEGLDKVAEAVYLVKLLESSPFFDSLPTKNWEMAPADAQSQELDRLFIGHLMYFHLQTMASQIFDIPCKIVRHHNFGESATVSLGIGLFPKLTFLNHSCCSNLHISTKANGSVVGRIVYPVKAGDEVTISYGDIGYFSDRTKEERQLAAAKIWDFICQCRACDESWPLIWDMKRKIELKCPKCEAAIPLRVLETIHVADYHCTGCERKSTALLRAIYDEFAAQRSDEKDKKRDKSNHRKSRSRTRKPDDEGCQNHHHHHERDSKPDEAETTTSTEDDDSFQCESKLMASYSEGGSWSLYPRSYLKSYKLLFVDGRPEEAAQLMENFLAKYTPVFQSPSYVIILATTHLFNCYNFMHSNVYFEECIE